MLVMNTPCPQSSRLIRMAVPRTHWYQKLMRGVGLISALSSLFTAVPLVVASSIPNGTWLSKPQILFHTSSRTLDSAMSTMKSQGYRIVFLDYRNIDETTQAHVSRKARQHALIPVVWVQSPQYRELTIPQMIHEARNGDGIQVDDHFFSNYALGDFYRLRSQYTKPIFCSIQPFQVNRVPPTGCNQLDVQCYSPESLFNCVQLADRLNAVTSLSAENTLAQVGRLGQRAFNVFLWPHSDRFFGRE